MSAALRLLLAFCAALTATLCAAQSDGTTGEYAQVRQLLDRGQPVQALARADTWLERNAGDPQMRFLRATALGDSGAQEQAAAALTALTRDYPELPEPHNNLAVIYAAQGRLQEARAALEEALRNNPQYAIAWANLGDIHTRLARQAWSRVQEIDRAHASAPAKLALLREALFAPQKAPQEAAPAGASGK